MKDFSPPAIVPWDEAPAATLAAIHTVITDVDDTITHQGQLSGAVLDALDRLRHAGVRIIPATAASAGWGSLMASLWPVDAVIAENGGVCFIREGGAVRRRFHSEAAPDLSALRSQLHRRFPRLEPAEDQPYRESCLAFRRLSEPEANAAVLAELAGLGARGTVNSLWLLAWPGPWDKLAASQRLLAEAYGQDFAGQRPYILYVGDSENDQPMFAALPHTVGVSTVVQHPLTHWPRWITRGPGGSGFVEVAERLVAARQEATATRRP
ncbi:MAG: HAD family hydrolase [Magnetospirillum sp.]|nr:HAD family hydrolase [Magnetospirillum sp.]